MHLIESLTERVIGLAIEVHRHTGPALPDSIRVHLQPDGARQFLPQQTNLSELLEVDRYGFVWHLS